jgi:hypothetical protein
MSAECSGGDVAAGERLGCRGVRGKGQRGGKTEPGSGRVRRVEGGEAGGGAATVVERRPGELYRRRSRGGREHRIEHVLGEEEERGEVRRTDL